MGAIRIETTVEPDGRILVPGIKAGEAVEVFVLRKAPRAKSYPLGATGGKYPSPFEPAIPEADWGDRPRSF